MADTVHFRRILVPVDFAAASDEEVGAGKAFKVGNHHVDFAPASRRSVELAAAVCRGAGPESRLCLVHATPTLDYSAMYTGPAGIALPAAVVAEIHENAKSASLQALELLAKMYCQGLSVDFVAEPSQPVTLILEQAERFGADLIVMAASGRSRVARFFVGSTADRIIRQAGCPVMVVPAELTSLAGT